MEDEKAPNYRVLTGAELASAKCCILLDCSGSGWGPWLLLVTGIKYGERSNVI